MENIDDEPEFPEPMNYDDMDDFDRELFGKYKEELGTLRHKRS